MFLSRDFADIKEIGAGTFSKVYSALHRLTGQSVCLKVFTNHTNMNFNAFENLARNEIKVMKTLNHPFIVQYFGSFCLDVSNYNTMLSSTSSSTKVNDVNSKYSKQPTYLAQEFSENSNKNSDNEKQQKLIDDEVNNSNNNDSNSENKIFVIVMELVKGVSLLDFINGFGRIGEKEAGRIFSQICSAFSYLDSMNIVHRDVKLENIMLDENYNVRLIDFGFSKNVSSTNNFMLKSHCGSFPYSAPELLQKKPYTKAVDVWSLGVILFAMVNGDLPFADSNFSSLVQKIFYMEPKCRKDIEDVCVDLISRLLEKNPAERATLDEVINHEFLKEFSEIYNEEDFCKKFHAKSENIDEISLYETIKIINKEMSNSNTNSLEAKCNDGDKNSNFNGNNNSSSSLKSHKLIQNESLSQAKIDKTSLCFSFNEFGSEIEKLNETDIQKIIKNRFATTDTNDNANYNDDIFRFKLDNMISLIYNIVDNKSKSKKLNILVMMRTNGHSKTLSKPDIPSKLPSLAMPVERKDTQLIGAANLLKKVRGKTMVRNDHTPLMQLMNSSVLKAPRIRLNRVKVATV